MVQKMIKSMPLGIGGSSAAVELNKLNDMTQNVQLVTKSEYQQRIKKAQQLMKKHNIAATYVNAELI